MKGPFTWSRETESVNAAQAVPYFRIADADDNTIGSCHHEENAMHITACLNRCWLSDLAHPTADDARKVGVVYALPRRRSHDQ